MFEISNNSKFKLLILMAVMTLVPAVSASPIYLDYLQSVYGTNGTSCSTCHISPPALNPYGSAFSNISTHNSDPQGALISIGAPFGLETDTIPPETIISGVIENGSYINGVTIDLTAADNPGGTGVNETIIIINGGSTTTYTSPFFVETIGQNNVTYWSTDYAGNIEIPKMVNFSITEGSEADTIPPETSICGVNENGFYNIYVTICLIASDNPGGAGVDETIFSVNGGTTSTYSTPFIVDTIGQNNITYWSSDNAGNIETPKMVNFTILDEASLDIIPPVTNIWGVIENGLYNTNVTISLTAIDNPGGTGVNETIFSINGGVTTTYTAPFIADKIGQNNVTYWSSDYAANVETPKIINFSIIPSISAVREIENISMLPGESVKITVRINSSINQAMALHEIIPQGWNITETSGAMDGFKNRTNEWIWFEMTPGVEKIITYTLKSPYNASIGTYQVNGSIQDENGIVANVEGNNSIMIDILEYYRRLGNDPEIVENSDLLTAIHDFRNAFAPPGFERPLNSEEIAELISEWMRS